MSDTTMRNIPIRNPELLEILDRFVELRTSDQTAFEEYMHLACESERNNRSWWAGDEYLEKVIAEGDRHEGFPDAMVGYEFRTNNRDHAFFKNEFPKTSGESEWRTSFMQNLSRNNQDIMQWLGTRNQALSSIYPPDGFIAWHNNANACAFNFIFSWSETGDGCFKYWDIEKKEVVVMQDEPGWQLKAGYFGHYGEPEKLVYHAAETNCWRHTLSFCFDMSPESELYREEIIEEISSE